MPGKAHDVLYLSEREIAATGIGMPQAIEVVETVLALHAHGQVILPSKIVLDLDEKRHGRINAMPAWVGGEINLCGIKWIAGFPNNPVRHGLPRANGLIVLNDPETGLPLAILEGTRISALRTGAVTGVGAKYLANPGSRTLALIGAGVQSRTQLEAIMTVLPELREVRVYDVRNPAAERFRTECEMRWNDLTVHVVDGPEPAVRGADCVVTATVADEPIVKADWLEPGVFFAHVGSYQEEEPAVILQADKVVVDLWEEVLHRRTPLLAKMYEAGQIDRGRIHANLGDIITGDKPGRERRDERIFFSPLGLGSEDIAVATAVYRRALKMNRGTGLEFGAAE